MWDKSKSKVYTTPPGKKKASLRIRPEYINDPPNLFFSSFFFSFLRRRPLIVTHNPELSIPARKAPPSPSSKPVPAQKAKRCGASLAVQGRPESRVLNLQRALGVKEDENAKSGHYAGSKEARFLSFLRDKYKYIEKPC